MLKRLGKDLYDKVNFHTSSYHHLVCEYGNNLSLYLEIVVYET